MIHKSSGFIRYDPYAINSTFKPWWVILKCDIEIVKYYQYVFYKRYWKKLKMPMWQSHISIVRGEKPVYPKNWKFLSGKVIEFSYRYDGEFYSNVDDGGKHFWIQCNSDEFSTIRESLGLAPEAYIPYHLTIGSID